MARVLDAEAIARLGAQAQVDLRATPPPAGAQPQTEIQKSGTLSRTGATLVETLATTVGQTTVMDVYGEPALTLVVTTPRKISAQGRETLQFASLSLGLAGGLLLATLLVVLRRSVLDPLSRLTAQVTALGTNDDFSVRLHLARRDEIGVLAREFDRMVENLAEARQRLLEQSYKSGIAEMASGVLHNIGNAITPLGVKLGNLKEVLHQAPVEEVDLAIAELADPATEPRRRSDMQGFVELASQELATLVRRTSQDLDGIQTQVDHVQQILAEQQRFSRAERVIEAVAVLPLIQETIRLLSENVRECLRVEVDPGVQQVGPVRATRVVLQQVISNLLINAAEAVADCRRQQPSGRVRISAAEEMREGVPMVHLRFADNGAGIPAENLPRIFTRGFSTKSRGSGMGLHWSANTVIALGGRMYAESAGPDQGACLHVLLPQAGTRQESLGNAA
jgi:signal transduction histidine kinase